MTREAGVCSATYMTRGHLPTAAGRNAPLTERQQQVFRQVAAGLTNKEIGFALGISERGVAAQVSRLLAKYAVPNRAALIAKVMSTALEGESRRPPDPLRLSPEMARECATYEHSAFQVGLTLGPDNLIVFVNEAGRRTMGVDVESAGGATFSERRGHPQSAAFVEGSRAAFRTGLPQTVENQSTRWLRDDGTWGSGVVSCVLQPVHRMRHVIGVLWICSAMLSQ
jgi:DNA-binding CsgD family transcriptional regulator